MKICLLGSGAADGIPAYYANTPVSQHARLHGGKDVRTRAAALIDDHIKVDLGPDTLCQLQREKLDMSDWSAIVFTHSHEDHICLSELQYAMYPFNEYEFAGFTIYGNQTICDLVHCRYPEWPFEVVRTCSFQPFRHAGFTITPIHANHKTDEDSQNLIFDDGSKVFLYATDTGVWFDETWEFLQAVRLDGMVIECTEGFARTGYAGHLDIPECLDVVTRLRKMGTLKPTARIVTTHHSHNGNATHIQLEAILLPEGIEPGFDGMVIEL